ncbi:MAG: hypothetical protein V1913_13625 [Fibrobacterota bacterium]
MSINQIGLNPSVVSQAYNRALVFDQMKKKDDAPTGPEAIAPAPNPSVEVQYLEGPPKEKPKPNTVPFKPGFMFEYGQGTDKGPVAVSITEKEKVTVDLKEDADADTRKKTIRSLVHLALKKIDRDGFNGMLEQGKMTPDGVKGELSMMGLKPEIPFGLGDNSYYFNARERLSAYKPLDIKG